MPPIRALLLLLACLLAVLVGIAAFSPLEGTVVQVSAPEGGDRQGRAAVALLRDQVDRLEAQLALASASHAELAEEVAALKAELRDTTAAADWTAAAPTPPEPNAEAEPRSPMRTPRASVSAGPDEDTLLAAGFSKRDVDAFRDRVDTIGLERLYLRDRATREGWIDSPRYAEERAALEGDLFATREEFGDEMYDWAMYSTGHPNRVEVTEVMAGSAASEAGLQPGDMVFAYADRRIFSAGDLRDQTVAGAAGETTPIEVVRNGERLRVFVPRGPLGVMLRPSAEEPAKVR